MNARLRNILMLVVILLAVVLLTPQISHAQSKSLRWHRWDSNIQINQDGTFTVREVLDIEFIGGPFSFGFRNIADDQVESITGFRVSEGGVIYQESQSQSPNTYYVSHSGGEYVVNWYYSSTIDERRTFTIEYVVHGGILVDEPGDILNWQVVGQDHTYPVEASYITVKLPDGAAVVEEDAPAVRGADATIEVNDDKSIVIVQSDFVPANQPIEMYVRFTHGVIPDTLPAWQESYEREENYKQNVAPMVNLGLGALAILVLVGGILGVYILWATVGRDPKVDAVPEYLTEPPSDLAPGIAGTLVDEKADMQDIMASVIDLARRGYIEMEEQEKKVFGITSSKDFVFKKLKESDDSMQLYEQMLIKEIFGRKDEIELDDLQYEFYTAIPKLQKQLYESAVEQELFPNSPKRIRGKYLALGIAALVLSMGGGFCISAAFIDRAAAILCPFVSVGIVAIVLLFISRVMPAKSQKGAEEAAKWNAFKTFLRNAEKYNDLEGMVDKFDEYLPYAVAFGLERTWINKFSRVPTTPMPAWYIPWAMRGGRMRRASTGDLVPGTGSQVPDLRADQVRPAPSLDGMSEGMFQGLGSMSDGLFKMLNTTSNVFTSVPRTSSSSGGFSGSSFSSGGFSSGGFSSGGSGGAGFG